MFRTVWNNVIIIWKKLFPRFYAKERNTKTQPKMADIIPNDDQKVLNLKRSVPLIEFHKDLLKRYLKYKWHPIVHIIGVFLLIITFASFFKSSAQVATFYPDTCLGGWQNAENATGEPSLASDATGEEFTKSNSAFIEDSTGSIFCGGFKAEIPTDTVPKHFSLTFSWSVDDGSTIHNQEEVNQVAPELVPENSSTDSSPTSAKEIAPDQLTPAPEPVLPYDEAPTPETNPQPTYDPVPGSESAPSPDPVPFSNEAPNETQSLLKKFFVNSAFAQETTETPETTQETPSETPPLPPDVSETPAEVSPTEPTEPIPSDSTEAKPPETNSPETPENTGTPVIPDISPTTPEPTPEVTDAFIEVTYTIDGTNWESLGTIGESNWQGAVMDIPLTGLEDLSKFQVGLRTLSNLKNPPTIYLDSMELRVEYDNKITQELPVIEITDPNLSTVSSDISDFSSGDTPSFTVTDPKLSVPEIETLVKDGKAEVVEDKDAVINVEKKVTSAPLDIILDPPVDAPKPDDTKESIEQIIDNVISFSGIKNAILALVEMANTTNQAEITDAVVLDSSGAETDIPTTITKAVVGGVEKDQVQIESPGRQFRPGTYTLKVTLKTDTAILISKQDFSWGVLVVNFNKSVYPKGGDAYIQMGVLDEHGHTICAAKLEMDVMTPTGDMTHYSTENDSENLITKDSECGPDNFVESGVPDYHAHFLDTNEEGEYKVSLTATTANGEKNISSKFFVQENALFDVERVTSSRIQPTHIYPVTLYVQAQNDFEGTVVESVPASFEITQPKNSLHYDSVETVGDTKVITWNVNFSAGEKKTLGYYYDSPDISPELFLLGPLEFNQAGNKIWQEARKWSIASDTATSATSAGTTADDATVGSVTWGTPGNATTSDNTYATCSTGGITATCHYLKATNFGFSIPSGATINGILAEIESKTSASTATWSNVRIVKGGTISSTTKSGATNGITTTEGYSSVPTSGATTDLWGETWTDSDINSSTFGVVFSTTIRNPVVSVDHIRITVYYTEAGISIAGTANGNNGGTVKVAINGIIQSQTATIASSAWSITGVTTPSANDIITVFVDGVSDANETTGVTKWSSGNVSGMVLNTGVVTVGSNQNTSLTVTNMGQYDADDDEDIMHTANSSALLIQGASNSYSGETLSILASNTLTIGSSESMTSELLNNAGTLTSTTTATYTLTGTSGTLFTNSGTFTQATSTVNITSASGTPTLLSAGTTFHILTINGSATVINAGATITIDDASGAKLYVQSGVLNDSGLGISTSASTTNTLQIDSGGTLCLGGASGANTSATCNTSAASTTARAMPAFHTYTFDSASTVIYMSDAATTISSTPTYGNLKLIPLFVTTSRTYTAGGALTINGDFTINPDESGASTPALTVNPAGTITVASGKNTTISKTNSATSTLDLRPSSTDYDFSTGLLNIATGGTLDAGSASSTITLTGTSGTLFTFNGTYTTGTSTVTMSGNGTATINTGSAPTFYNLNSSGTGTKTLGTNITVSRVLNVSAGTFAVSSFTTTLSGTTGTPLVNTATFDAGTGTVIYTGNNGAGNTTVASTVTYYNLEINGSGETYVLNGTTTVNASGTTTLTAGDLDTTGSNFTLSTGKIVCTSGMAGFYPNASTVNMTATSGNLFSVNVFSCGWNIAGTATFNLSGNGDAVINDAVYSSFTLDNLTLTGTGVKSIGGTSFSLNNNLTVSAGVYDDPNSNEITVSGNIIVNNGGTLRVRDNDFFSAFNYGGTVTLNSGSTVEYTPFVNSQTQTIDNTLTYSNLLISNVNGYTGSLKNLNGTTTVTGTTSVTGGTLDTVSGSNFTLNTNSVSIGASGTLRARVSNITVTGDWTNAGTFTADTSTVTFNGGTTATIGGGPTTFYKLTITHSSAKEVDFSTSGTHIIHVTNLFTVTGSGSGLIKLYSTSGGTKWHFHPTGTASVDYADIKDGGCESGAITITPTNTTDSGNNESCWSLIKTLTFSLGSNSVALGTLSTGSANFGSHTITAATNAPGGYNISYKGVTLTNGTYTIPVYSSSSSSPGTAGFGINLKANTVPSVGANPTTNSGTCTIASGYNTANSYSFVANTTTNITNISAPADCVFTASYVGNISATTAAGSYSTVITYLATGSF